MTTTPVDPPCEHCGAPKADHLEGVLYCPADDVGYEYDQVFRRRPADMPRLGVAPHPSVPLGSYVHGPSGGRYEVIGGTFDASREDDCVDVLYQSVADGYLAHRPPGEFRAEFRPVAEGSP
jgi:hypothetical protein